MPVMAGGTSNPLFTRQELAQFLQVTVSEESAAIAERVASGWLKDAMGVAHWPEHVSDQVWGWAIQLGAIAHENPAGYSARTIGDDQWQWSKEHRAEILTAARGASSQDGVPATTSSLPRGSFPQAEPWPDPAGRCRRW